MPLDDITTVPDEALPAALAAIAAEVAQHVVALTRITARLAARHPAPAPSPPDEMLTAAQVATLIGRSLTWLRHHGHTLPGFSQPQGRGTAVRWSRNAIHAWLASDNHSL